MFKNVTFQGTYQVYLDRSQAGDWRMRGDARIAFVGNRNYHGRTEKRIVFDRLVADLAVDDTMPPSSRIIIGGTQAGVTPGTIRLPLTTDPNAECLLVRETDKVRLRKSVALPKLEPYRAARIGGQSLELVWVSAPSISHGIALDMSDREVKDRLGEPSKRSTLNGSSQVLLDYTDFGLSVGFRSGRVVTMRLLSEGAGDVAGMRVGEKIDVVWLLFGYVCEHETAQSGGRLAQYRYKGVDIGGVRGTISMGVGPGAIVRAIELVRE